MKPEAIQHKGMPWKLIFMGICLCSFVWVFGSFLDVLLSQGKSLSRQAVKPTVVEIIMRICIMVFFLGFGAYYGLTRKRLRTKEIELYDSGQQYRILAETSPDIIFTLSLEGTFTTLSPAFYTLTGFSQSEYLGRHFHSIIHPEDLHRAIDAFERLMAGQPAPPYELRILSKSGASLIGEVISAPQIKEGKILGILGIVRNITMRKRLEQSLMESEAKCRELFDNAHDLVQSTGPDGTFHSVNRAWRETLGYTGEEIAHMTVLDIIHPDSRIHFKEMFERILAGERIDRIGATFATKVGKPVIVEGTVKCSSIIDGRPVATLGIFRNITEYRHNEEFIRNILDTVDEGFIVISRDFKIISANKAYCSKLKLPLDNIIDRHCYQISHHMPSPCYDEGDNCVVRRTFETGEPHTAVHTHRDKEGDTVYTEVKSFPLKNSRGEIISAIEIHNDITEKKKLEEQLLHSQKMEAVGTLAGGVAHDFNNILTAIIGYSSLMQMKMTENDPFRPSVNSILASTERAANLTQSLLAFSRKQVLSPKHVDMNTIVRRVEKLTERLIGEDIEMTLVLHNKPLPIKADTGQLEQIMINLFTNARDAMPQGGNLSIETGEVELSNDYIKSHGYGKAGKYALLTVTDTGVGMDKKTIKRIYEPFFTTKSTGKGTGLGLAMVYGIVKQHSGYISVYSEPGIGTTFKVYLPQINTAIEHIRTVSAPLPKGCTETLLVAEDDSSVRNLTTAVLKGFGYTVIEASDGEEALLKFRDNKDTIKLLVLDAIMPKKNGQEAYNEIKKLNPSIKAIFTSGYTAEIIQTKNILEEGITLLSKPVSPNKLLNTVAEMLDKRSGETC
jgi:PAS domain S-box-containing protein